MRAADFVRPFLESFIQTDHEEEEVYNDSFALLFGSFVLTSCDAATGQGAGWGAATGRGPRCGRPRPGRSSRGRPDWRKHRRHIAPQSTRLARCVTDPARWRLSIWPSNGKCTVYRSPYPPHAGYDLRGIPHGSLVEDRVAGGYFRKTVITISSEGRN